MWPEVYYCWDRLTPVMEVRWQGNLQLWSQLCSYSRSIFTSQFKRLNWNIFLNFHTKHVHAGGMTLILILSKNSQQLCLEQCKLQCHKRSFLKLASLARTSSSEYSMIISQNRIHDVFLWLARDKYSPSSSHGLLQLKSRWPSPLDQLITPRLTVKWPSITFWTKDLMSFRF